MWCSGCYKWDPAFPRLLCTRMDSGGCGSGSHPAGRSPIPLVGKHAKAWVPVHVSAHARVSMCLWRSMHSQPRGCILCTGMHRHGHGLEAAPSQGFPGPVWTCRYYLRYPHTAAGGPLFTVTMETGGNPRPASRELEVLGLRADWVFPDRETDWETPESGGGLWLWSPRETLTSLRQPGSLAPRDRASAYLGTDPAFEQVSARELDLFMPQFPLL